MLSPPEECLGDLALQDSAVGRVPAALAIYEAMPAPASAAEASADLALCELRLGRVDEAVARLEKANRSLTEQGLRTHEGRPAHRRRARTLSQARRACRAALAHGRTFQAGYPYAARVRGTSEWLRGKRAAADRWWRRSLIASARMGTRHLAGQTHLEIGRRTGAREHLEDGARIFEEIGATLDLTEARAELERRDSVISPRPK